MLLIVQKKTNLPVHLAATSQKMIPVSLRKSNTFSDPANMPFGFVMYGLFIYSLIVKRCKCPEYRRHSLVSPDIGI